MNAQRRCILNLPTWKALHWLGLIPMRSKWALNAKPFFDEHDFEAQLVPAAPDDCAGGLPPKDECSDDEIDGADLGANHMEQHTPRAHEQSQFPTLEEYHQAWAAKVRLHERPNRGRLSGHNLVPKPNHQLWQDAPHVPFNELTTREAQARLSVCRPHCELQDPQVINYKPKYAHLKGDVLWKRRGPLQLACTAGFF